MQVFYKNKSGIIYAMKIILCLLIFIAFITGISFFGLNKYKQYSEKPISVILKEKAEAKITVYPTLPPSEVIIPTQASEAIVSNTPITIPEGELYTAINTYRLAHGLNALTLNNQLCVETRKRVQDILSSGVLSHDGMEQDIRNGVLRNLVGKASYGENLASAYCKRPSDGVNVDVSTSTQLVEWCFDSSEGHKANLLNPTWTDVCSSGQFPYYVETFAK